MGMCEKCHGIHWNSSYYVVVVWLVVWMYARLLRRTHSFLRPQVVGPSHISRTRGINTDRINDILLQYEEEFKTLHNSPELVNKLENLADKHPEMVTQMDLYRKIYPFPLDNFQIQSLQSLISGNNALVMTPTGSGKTVVGELAIYFSLMMGLRVAYTTPLKALSNQKFLDFRNKFGADRVGLLTGDLSINRDAPITIMTTEIFRNMVYNQDNSKSLSNLFMVCFDEFHYMNDPGRGTIWEESVISCPSSVRILALSATMGNVEDLRNWMSAIHGPTTLIKSDHRPVPLRYFLSTKNGLSPLFSDPNAGPGSLNGISRNLHGKVLETCNLHPSIIRSEKHLQEQQSQLRHTGNRRQQYFNRQKSDIKMRHLFPKYSDVAKELLKRDKLPAIFFIFSRTGCEEAAEEVLNRGLDLISKAEEQFIDNVLTDFMKNNPTIPVSRQNIRLLQAGIGVHHAGLIPIWKSLIESLFNANKIKILFATETLAAGVNMPARTTVITASSKRVDSKTVKLKTSQMLQMAGRAGRRGKDVEGSVVIMRNQHEEASVPYRILISSIDGIKSHFRTSYSLTASLLNRKSLPECRSLIERGFGAFLLQQRIDKRKRNDEVEKVHRAIFQKYGFQEIDEYRQLVEQLHSERKLLSKTIHNVKREEQDIVESVIDYISAGTAVKLRNGSQGYFLGKFVWEPFSTSSEEDTKVSSHRKGYFRPSDMNESDSPTEDSRLGVLTRENLLYMLGSEHILAFDTDSSALDLGSVTLARETLMNWSEWEECKVTMPTLTECMDADSQFSSGPVLAKSMTKHQCDNLALTDEHTQMSEVASTFFHEIPSESPRIASQIKKIKEVRNQVQQHAIAMSNDTDAILNAFQYLTFHSITDLQRFMKQPGIESAVEVTKDNVTTKITASPNASNENSKDLFAWRMFLVTADILQSFYACYLDDAEVKLLPLGETVAAIAHDNELWMALILQHPAIAGSAHAQYMQSLTRAKLGPILAKKQAQRNEIVSSFPIGPSKESSAVHIDEESCCLSHESFIFNVYNQHLELRVKNKKMKNNFWQMRRKEERQKKLDALWEDMLDEAEEDEAGEIKEDDFEEGDDDDDDDFEEGMVDDKIEPSASSVDMEEDNYADLNSWEIKDAYEFAGIVAATFFENSRGHDKATIFKRTVPRNIHRFGYEIEEILMRLQSKQDQASDVHMNSPLLEYPISFSAEMGGLVSYWAKGNCTWRDLCRLTALDQGDLCRILRRTVEFLRQIPDTPHISEKVLLMSWKAIGALDRFPVTDMDPVLLQEQQKLQQEQDQEENINAAIQIWKEKKKITKAKSRGKNKNKK